jgi:hypothetical protein
MAISARQGSLDEIEDASPTTDLRWIDEMLGNGDRLWSSTSNCHGHAGPSQHCEVIQPITDCKDLIGAYAPLLAVGLHTGPLGDSWGADSKAEMSVIRLRV